MTAVNPCEGITRTADVYAGPWYDAVKENIVAKFEAETGGKVDLIPTYGEALTNILAAPAAEPPFDVTTIFVSDFARGNEEGAYLPLRKENIPNLNNVSDFFAQKTDEQVDGNYAAPFDFLFNVIGYNKQTLGFTPTSFADLWGPEAQGKIAPDAVFWYSWLGWTALTLDDLPLDGEIYTEEGVDKIIEELQKLDVALWFESGAEATAAMDRGDAAIVSQAMEVVAPLAMNDPDKYEVIIPSEGMIGAIDWFGVVRGTDHRDCAEIYINYLLDPEAQAGFVEDVQYWMSNSEVQYGPNATNFLPATVEEWERSAVFLDWTYLVDNWDFVEGRLRQEVLSQ